MQDIAQWPAGATYVAQGTVAEDATAGTHNCTLTVTPGAGNELQFMYGSIVVGNTATAQSAFLIITDGVNQIDLPFNISGTTANLIYSLNTTSTVVVNGAVRNSFGSPIIISGIMQLILKVATAAISVTHTFAVACRTRGGKPSTVLADTVGAPVLTLNTDKLF